MSAKEYYIVPVYLMLAEDFVCKEVEFKLLDKIIVSKTKKGYEELDGFNNFVMVKSKKDESRKINIANYTEHLYLNEDDFKEENKVEFYKEENIVCYRKTKEKLKLKYYDKDKFNSFLETKKRQDEKILVRKKA